MAKINQVIVYPNEGYDDGETAKNKINEAMKTVESGSGLSGGGTEADPLLLGDFDSLNFNIDPPVITGAGKLKWNNKEYTVDLITGLGAVVQIGQEMLLLYYNDTGAQIDNFTVLHPKSAIEISGLFVPTPEKADASKWELCEGTLTLATHNIPDGQLGFATRFGKARGGNSTGWTPGVQLWLSADGSGIPTATKPIFPNYSISIGGSIKEHATEGEIFVSITKAVGDTFNDAWDGGIRETFNFTVSSNGTIVTGLLENVNPVNNLTLFFSDGALFHTLDTTTSPLTIALISGTDELTTTNFVYIPIATKILTISTSGFPETEHCKVAILEVQSAATIQTIGGARRNQNINDHIKKEDDNGHVLHIAERIRQMNADHDSGTEGTLTGTTANGYIQVSGGKVWQMHKQDFPSISMPTDSMGIVNDSVTAYRETNNLNTIDAYSDGISWNNEWSNIVIWGVINKTGQPSFIFGNLPSDGYTSEANAVNDANNFTNYSIPSKYKGVGFLIGRFTIKIQGGIITYNSSVGYLDLRGFVPNNISGGGFGGGVTSLLALSDVFINSYAGKKGHVVKINDLETGIDSELKNWFYNIARTFKAIFNFESITADRTFTWPNKSGTVAMLSDLSSIISSESPTATGALSTQIPAGYVLVSLLVNNTNASAKLVRMGTAMGFTDICLDNSRSIGYSQMPISQNVESVTYVSHGFFGSPTAATTLYFDTDGDAALLDFHFRFEKVLNI